MPGPLAYAKHRTCLRGQLLAFRARRATDEEHQPLDDLHGVLGGLGELGQVIDGSRDIPDSPVHVPLDHVDRAGIGRDGQLRLRLQQ